MIRNYFKTAFRNLWKHKIFSFINLTGLAIGMTACFLIFLYVRFELSYDRVHKKADRIYRLVCDTKTPTETLYESITSAPMAINIKRDFPEVEAVVRIEESSFLVRRGDIKFQEERSLYADSAFFSVFDFPLVKGDPRKALTAPLSIVLSESAAQKYFGSSDPMGQTLLLRGDNLVATVTGVMKDFPGNTHFRADMLLSMSTRTQKLNPDMDNQWGNFGYYSYLLLKEGTNAQRLQEKFPAFLERRNGKEMKESQMYYTLLLEPLKDVYLKSKRISPEKGSLSNVYIFSVIAIFILVIACINFVNLTTARAAERAREVGIRKVVGAARNRLIAQFLGESVLICLIAFLLTIFFCSWLLPPFNQLAGKTIAQSIFENSSYVITLLSLSIGIGLIAGFYPAMVLSGFQPITVLKGRFSSGRKGIVLRQGLVIGQFTVSIVLIAGTLIVYKQLHFMRSRDLGFAKDQMLVMNYYYDRNIQALKSEIDNIPGVLSTSLSSSMPGVSNNIAYSQIENKSGEMQIANLDVYFTDFDFLDQYKIKLIAGRTFSRDLKTDSTEAMIINEEAVKSFGYNSPRDIIGKRFSQWGREGTIIGVIRNFNFQSLHQVVKPLSVRIEPENWHYISIHVTSANLPATLNAIENRWKKAIPNRPFSYFFADEAFDRQYRTEERFGSLFLNFAILAIFISCLGLLGLASYSTMQRTKEIGIRKVMGANVTNIVNLLSKDFLKLVAIAILTASPIAWLTMNKWLQDFSYRIEISWWILALSGLAAIIIAVVTVSFQAIKAAMANPVKSLRTE
jgi:putative ABC transport system permease protein